MIRPKTNRPPASRLVSVRLVMVATLAAVTVPSCGAFRDESPEQRDARRYERERREAAKSQEYYRRLNHKKARRYERDQRYDEWYRMIME